MTFAFLTPWIPPLGTSWSWQYFINMYDYQNHLRLLLIIYSLPGLTPNQNWIRSSRSPMARYFIFLNRHLRWLLWLDKSGKSQCREKIMGFGAWHIQFQNLALPFIIGVTLGKLLNMSLSFLNYKIWILAMLEVVIKFSVLSHSGCSVNVNLSLLLLILPKGVTNANT